MELKKKNCVPCEGGIPPLTSDEVKTLLSQVNTSWNVIGNKKIEREFHFVNFVQTMEFVNKVAEMAEQEGHHPDLKISYGICKIILWTHAINGLSENDFILAAKIDELI